MTIIVVNKGNENIPELSLWRKKDLMNEKTKGEDLSGRRKTAGQGNTG